MGGFCGIDSYTFSESKAFSGNPHNLRASRSLGSDIPSRSSRSSALSRDILPARIRLPYIACAYVNPSLFRKAVFFTASTDASRDDAIAFPPGHRNHAYHYIKHFSIWFLEYVFDKIRSGAYPATVILTKQETDDSRSASIPDFFASPFLLILLTVMPQPDILG
jgi:hypothetical protein